jgi:hypothetical protein
MMKNIFENKIVSVIGSAGYLQKNNFGKEIDDSDIVVRINKGSNILKNSNKIHLGSKVDVLYHCLLEDPQGSSGLKTGFITPDKWYAQGVRNVFCLPKSDMKGQSYGNYLSDLINIEKVKELNSLIPVTMINYQFYNQLAKGILCKPNTGIAAIFHILACKPRNLKVFGFSFMLDGWYKDYRDPKLFESFNWHQEEKISYEEAVNRGFNSKRHKQKETWEYCKKNLLNNKIVTPDPWLDKILRMDIFSKEEYAKMVKLHEEK